MAQEQRALDTFYGWVERECAKWADDPKVLRFGDGQHGLGEQVIALTNGHMAIFVPGAFSQDLARSRTFARLLPAAAGRVSWDVPSELASLLAQVKPFILDGRKRTAALPVQVEIDAAARLIVTGRGGTARAYEDWGRAWTPVNQRVTGVSALDLRYLEPVAKLAAVVPVRATWTPDADDIVSFDFPTGARYIIMPLRHHTGRTSAQVERAA